MLPFGNNCFWGKGSASDGSNKTIYVYDEEFGLYYLQSRYYNAGLGRFNAPDAFASTGQGILGNNMYAYCNNNPTNCYDPSGNAAFCTTNGDRNPLFIGYLGMGGGAGGGYSSGNVSSGQLSSRQQA